MGSSVSPINLESITGFLHIFSIRFINTVLSGYSLSGIPKESLLPKILCHILSVSFSF